MKIISLQAENIKKLVAVEITPDGNVVQITGANGNGKTSVLDAIWWALEGASHIQASPIRKGATTARIRLDLGELIVTRTFAAKDGGYTTKISVQNAEGGTYPSPQSVIDKLLGELSFDPLGFARATPKDQFNILRKFVPDVDFEKIDLANRADYEKRRDINRQAKEADSAMASISVPDVLPADDENESDLLAKMSSAAKINAEIATRKANRERLAREAQAQREEADALRARANALDEAAGVTREKLKAAPPLPELVNVADLEARINAQRASSDARRAKIQRDNFAATAKRLFAEADELTASMEKREAAKAAAIAAAKLPVEGLTFGVEEVLLAGVPFAQGSDAEQLRASIAIAMALNPKLRVIRVRDGSLLDDASMKLLAEMAEKHDYQVWIERVETSGKVGFVLEDGYLKGTQSAGGTIPPKETAVGGATSKAPEKRQVKESAPPAPAAQAALDEHINGNTEEDMI